MVNTEEFTKRLNIIMDFYGLSAASFAEKIEVGRSSISHLLSGRNKPSLDFVMKVVHTFPEVELYWLLNGKGHFPPQKEKVHQEKTPDLPDLFSGTEKKTPESSSSPAQKKQIQKIVIFYADGSFEAFQN